MDWKQLAQLTGPSLGALAAGGRTGAFMKGYTQEQEKLAQERRQKEQEAQRRSELGARTSLELLSKLTALDDPVEQQQMLSVIQQHRDAFGLPQGFLDNFQVKSGDAQLLKELADQLEAMGANFDLDDPAVRGAEMTTKSGRVVTVEDALRLTHQRPIDPTTKKPIVKPTAPVKPEERYVKGPDGKPQKAVVTWVPRLGGFIDEHGTRVSLAAEPDKAPTTPLGSDVHQAAALRGKIRAAKAAGDTALVADLEAQLGDLEASVATFDKLRRDPQAGPRQEFNIQEQFKNEQSLRKEWTQETRNVDTMQRQYDIMQTALKNYDRMPAAGAESIIMTHEKILDTDSVVRESEFYRLGSGQPLWDRMRGILETYKSGGQKIPKDKLVELVGIAQQFVVGARAYAEWKRQTIDATIKKYGFDPALIYPQGLPPMLRDDTQTQTTQTPGGDAAAARAKLLQRRQQGKR